MIAITLDDDEALTIVSLIAVAVGLRGMPEHESRVLNAIAERITGAVVANASSTPDA